MFHQIFLQNVFLLIIAVNLTKADQWDVWGGRGLKNIFCQIIIKSELNWLESKTKIFGAANHPRHPQTLDSLLNLNTKIWLFFLFFFCKFF